MSISVKHLPKLLERHGNGMELLSETCKQVGHILLAICICILRRPSCQPGGRGQLLLEGNTIEDDASGTAGARSATLSDILRRVSVHINRVHMANSISVCGGVHLALFGRGQDWRPRLRLDRHIPSTTTCK